LDSRLRTRQRRKKYWPAIEEPIRARRRIGKHTGGVLASTSGGVDATSSRPKEIADAWQPLYPTLSPEQKRRMAALTIFVFREMRNGLEQRRIQSEDDDQG